MLVRQLLYKDYERKDDEDPEEAPKENLVDASDKTKLYITLDNMLDYLQVYRDKLKGNRIPYFQANFLERQ